MDIVYAPILIKRLVAFALLWWLLTGGNMANWPLAVLVIVISAGISTAYSTTTSWSMTGLLTFLPFFIWHSIKGGVDVAVRTFRRSLPLEPQVIGYTVRLPVEPARLFFANTINLLPGTLCTELQETALSVHVLDAGGNFQHELEALERRVALLYKVSLASNSGDHHATV